MGVRLFNFIWNRREQEQEWYWYTTAEVALMCGCSTNTVRRWIRQGRLGAIPFNNRWRIPRGELVRLGIVGVVEPATAAGVVAGGAGADPSLNLHAEALRAALHAAVDAFVDRLAAEG